MCGTLMTHPLAMKPMKRFDDQLASYFDYQEKLSEWLISRDDDLNGETAKEGDILFVLIGPKHRFIRSSIILMLIKENLLKMLSDTVHRISFVAITDRKDLGKLRHYNHWTDREIYRVYRKPPQPPSSKPWQYFLAVIQSRSFFEPYDDAARWKNISCLQMMHLFIYKATVKAYAVDPIRLPF